MTYKEGKKKNFLKSFFIFIFIILFLFILTSSRVYNNLNGFFHTLATPFWNIHNNVYLKFNNIKSIFYSNITLQNDNEYLKSQIFDLQIRAENLNIILKENEDLKGILGRSVGEKPILANIITWPRQSVYDVITIDMGSLDGVKVGKRIYAFDTAILGEVVEVYENTSKVNLYSTSGTKTTGIIEGSNTVIDLEGKGGGSFIINVPRDIVLQKGMKILAIGDGNYVIAKIDEIIQNDTDPLTKIFATSLVNVNQLKSVLVEK